MKKVFSVLILVAMSSVANASDVALRRSAGTLASETFDWTGSYIGLNSGFVSSTTKLTTINSNTSSYPDFGVGESNDTHLTGFAIGGEVGYNQQSRNFVYGVFGALAYSSSQATSWSVNACCGAGDDEFKSKIRGWGIIGGRFGYAFNKLLVSVNAGVAFGNYNLKINDHNSNYQGIPQTDSYGGGSDNKWLTGLALGVGVDYALTSNWILGVDYKYVFFAPKNLSAGGTGYHNNGTPYGPVTYVMAPNALRTQIFGVNVKYKF